MTRRLIALLFLLLTPALALAQAPARPDFEALRQEVTQIETQLARNTQADSELAALRARIEPVIATIIEFLGNETPRLEEINARLAEIGPKPAANAPPESAEVTRSREEQEALKRETDETIRVTRLLLVRAEQVLTSIADRRRALFKRQILERTHSIISPWLWLEIARVAPETVEDLRAFMRFRVNRAASRIDATKGLAAGALLLLLAVGFVPALRLQRRIAALPDIETPTRLHKAVAALRRALAPVLLPAIACALFLGVLDILGIGVDRLGEMLKALAWLLPVFAALRGLSHGVLAPGEAAWRLPHLSDHTARSLFDLARIVIWILVAGKAMEAINQAIFAALPVTIATRGLAAFAIAGLTLNALRRIEATREDSARAGEDALVERSPYAMLARFVTLAAALAIAVAALTGFIALASFLTDQAFWIAGIGATLGILLILSDEAVGKGLSRASPVGRNIGAATGLSASSLQQIGILSSGLTRLCLFAAAAMLAAAPWGVESGDVVGSLRAAFFGFQLGGVTVSLATIAIAITVFAAGFFITRSIQRWLEGTYLPSTGLDVGLRNSIKTVFGYIGFIVAAVLSMGYLGISLDKVTLVAGALSVGIGFGLQSIVNNFVSGLILLWERPIRVGDWIVVGEEQGTVKRINVRATEIETFDKASLIVPNSEFISGRVKNWMHNDRMARIILPIGVSYGADPEHVKKLLLNVALAHREVLSAPAPNVFFMKLGESSLDFELRCFVDVDVMLATRSELLFEIFSRLKSEGIDVPFPRRTVEIADIDRLGRTIAENIPR